MMAMAALPGALDKANIVGSSLVQVAKALPHLQSSQGPPARGLNVIIGHDSLKVVDVRCGKC